MDLQKTACWCGNKHPIPFSEEYALCDSCHTLISKAGLSLEETQVTDDESSFYGKNYWLTHQTNDLGCSNIYERARSDLSERCLYWLRILLKYKLPPAKIFELGSMHGGFIGLLNQTGYNATGSDLSPWVVDYAQKTFEINMSIGPIEQQQIQSNSLDVIILMDVMEHLADPVTTLRHCLTLLKTDGILLIQTPCYPKNKTYQQLSEEKNRFLEMLQAKEHLYLFSKEAAQQIFQQLNACFIQHEPAIFEHDMFFIVSKSPIKTNSPEQIDTYLMSSSRSRYIQAMLDLADKYDHLYQLYRESEIDRANRLDSINKLTQLYQECETDRANRLNSINKLTQLYNKLLSKIREKN